MFNHITRLAAVKNPPPRAGQINSSIILGVHMGGRSLISNRLLFNHLFGFNYLSVFSYPLWPKVRKGVITPLLALHRYSHNVSHTFHKIPLLLYMYPLLLYYLGIQLNISIITLLFIYLGIDLYFIFPTSQL